MTKNVVQNCEIFPNVIVHIQLNESIALFDLNTQFLDALVYPDSEVEEGIIEPYGLLCFGIERDKELIVKALESAVLQYPDLKRIVLYCLPSLCKEAECIKQCLQSARIEVDVRFLPKLWSAPNMFSIILTEGSIDAKKSVASILSEIRSALNGQAYDLVGFQFDRANSRVGNIIMKALRFSGYEIRFLGFGREDSEAYEISNKKRVLANFTATTLASKGRVSLDRGLEVQNQVTMEYRKVNSRIIISTQRTKPDIVAYDPHGTVIEVVAVKSYSLEVTNGRGCRNCKGHKYVASFKACRDAKAECVAAKKHGLSQLRLIVINLKTNRRIFDDKVGFTDKVTLRESDG